MAMNDDEAAARSALLIRDAEEALTQERMRAFWQAWGSTIIGMAIMLVIGTGAGVAWREWRQSTNESSTSKLLTVLENPDLPLSDTATHGLTGEHAAIAWLSRASTTKQAELEKLFGQAAIDGKDSVWGWLARWNELRVRMDNDKEDAGKLIADYEKLAQDANGQALSALAYADAAIIAGERQKDPQAALKYIAQAEKVVPRATGPMSVLLADLKHLYEIRANAIRPDDAAVDVDETKVKETE